MPSTKITIVRRSDSSGTTQNFSEFLVKGAPGVWTLGSASTINWPATSVGGNGNGGVASVIKSTNGAIGYVDYPDAKASGLVYASVKNSAGNYIAPSVQSATTAASNATIMPNLTFSAIWAPGAQSYPITYQSWVLVYQSQTGNNGAAPAGLGRLSGRGRSAVACSAELRAAARQPAVDGASASPQDRFRGVTITAPEAPHQDLSGPGAGLSERRPLGDRAFQILALASGLLVLVILVLIAISTTKQSTDWFTTAGFKGVFSKTWNPAAGQYGALSFIYGTLVTAVIAVIIAVPLSLGIALLLTEVVSPRVARPIVSVIDLLAVVPSVVFGLWGFLVFGPWIAGFYSSVASAVHGIPILDDLFGSPTSGLSFFTAGIILAVMIIPIVTSLSREVFATVPAIDKEGAYALGATRLEMIQGAVWPHSKGAVVGAVLLGCRAGHGRDDRGRPRDWLIGHHHLSPLRPRLLDAIGHRQRVWRSLWRAAIRPDRSRRPPLRADDHHQPGRQTGHHAIRSAHGR